MRRDSIPAVFMTDSHLRSAAKGVTWRVTATLDTIFLAFLVTGVMFNAVKIGLIEIITKVGLYYLHERLWNVIPFGRIHGVGPTHARSLVKGISWRIFGTIDTVLIAFFVTGIWTNAIAIGGFELITKITLYYLHERAWGKLKWGRIIRKTQPAPLQTTGRYDKLSMQPSRVQEKEAVLH
jgi:uncharacterized membrane protein